MIQPCKGHPKPIKVFKSPVPVWAGPAAVFPPNYKCVVLDLAGRYLPAIRTYKIKVTIPTSQPIISIDWPDFGTPNLITEDWKAISKAIIRSKRPIFVTCLMGHGRTGTALSILARMWGQSKDNPIKFVRDRYCSNAVESNQQIGYVADILGDKSIETEVPKIITPNVGFGLDADFVSSSSCLSYRSPAANEKCIGPNGVESAVGHSCKKPYMHKANHECDYCKLQWAPVLGLGAQPNYHTLCTVRNQDARCGHLCDNLYDHDGAHMCKKCMWEWA